MKRVLVVNDYVDQTTYAPQMQNLCSQVTVNCEAEIDTVAYQDFNIEYVEGRMDDFVGIVMSGSEALYSKADDRNKFAEAISAIRRLSLPVLGICGGHQLIAMAYAQQIAPTGKPIKGYRNVTVIDDDPLFEETSVIVSVMQSHQEMVERLPEGFRHLARSDETPIEAFCDRNKRLYGVQFHPERNEKDHPAGARILANFGRLLSQ